MRFMPRRNRGAARQSKHEKQAFSVPAAPFTKAQTRRLTRNRKFFAVLCSVLYFLALFFLILVNIGNVRNKNILTNWYLFKIDLSRIQVSSYSGPVQFSNSLAQTIGLHDFYQVGLWNWCEGYDNSQGVTYCAPTEFGYWFNPVEIILNELFAGASIVLPSQIYEYLNIIKIASRAMFGTFFAGTILSFVMIFLSPLALYSRLLTIVIGILSLLTSLCVIVGAVISTVMWNIFTSVINNNAAGLGLEPIVGLQPFIFMWIAAGCALIAAITQLSLMCCCTSRRDVKLGKKNAKKELEHMRETNGVAGTSEDQPYDGQTLNSSSHAV